MANIKQEHAGYYWECIDCGHRNAIDTTFCLVCNHSKQVDCPNCQSLIDESMAICPVCGIDIPKYSSAYEDLSIKFKVEVDEEREDWKRTEAERAEREIASSSAKAKRMTSQALMLFGVLFVFLMTLFVTRQIREQEKQAMLSLEYESAANCLGEYNYKCARDHLHYVLSMEPRYRDAHQLLDFVYTKWIGETVSQGDVGLLISLIAERILLKQ